MSGQITFSASQVATAISALMAQVKTMNQNAVDLANGAKAGADNAAKLEGLTLNEVVELIAGTTGITVQEVQDNLDAFVLRTDNPHGVTKAQIGLGNVENYAPADNTQGMDSANSTSYITPVVLWHVINTWWSDIAGTSPETLDTINEIAAALQNNPDVIQTLQDGLALKASTADLNTAISNLESQITAAEPVWATSAEAVGILYTYTATASQTVFTGADDNTDVLAFEEGAELVVQVNGVNAAFTSDATADSVTLTTAAAASDTVTVKVFDAKRSMTPATTKLVRDEIEAEVQTAMATLETAFNDALAALQA